MWQDWTVGIIGLAILGIAFLGLTGSALTWTLAIAGILTAILGFWAAGTTQRLS